MSSMILQAETLNLPEMFAAKLRGRRVELTASEDAVIIKPVQNVIESMCGMLKSDGREVDRFMAQKRIEKELEYVGEIHA